MTPKEQYEARKAERKGRQLDFREKEQEADLLVERAVLAVELIADALDRIANVYGAQRS
jgi:hypothetical protein